MKNRVIDAICCVFKLCGIPFLVREVLARNKVTILNYHDPEPNIFEAHLTYYSKHYNFIHIDNLYEVLRNGSFSNLPPKSLIITLDDGHKGNAALLPIIRKMGVPVVIYAVAGLVGSRKHFWFRAEGVPKKVIRQAKFLQNSQRIAMLEEQYGYIEKNEYPIGHSLSTEEIREFLLAGAIVGCHTMTHPLLPQCDNKVIIEEITASKILLSELLGYEVKHFAYPGGAWDAATYNAVKNADFATARTICPGFVTMSTDPLLLPNFGIADNASLNKAIVQASGIWSLLLYLKPNMRKELAGDYYVQG
ncbi:MAG: polysaccharide deacetylase family protein [Gimesia sp.]